MVVINRNLDQSRFGRGTKPSSTNNPAGKRSHHEVSSIQIRIQMILNKTFNPPGSCGVLRSVRFTPDISDIDSILDIFEQLSEILSSDGQVGASFSGTRFRVELEDEGSRISILGRDTIKEKPHWCDTHTGDDWVRAVFGVIQEGHATGALVLNLTAAGGWISWVAAPATVVLVFNDKAVATAISHG